MADYEATAYLSLEKLKVSLTVLTTKGKTFIRVRAAEESIDVVILSENEIQ